jgi:hypothetical protein
LVWYHPPYDDHSHLRIPLMSCLTFLPSHVFAIDPLFPELTSCTLIHCDNNGDLRSTHETLQKETTTNDRFSCTPSRVRSTCAKAYASATKKRRRNSDLPGSYTRRTRDQRGNYDVDLPRQLRRHGLNLHSLWIAFDGARLFASILKPPQDPTS